MLWRETSDLPEEMVFWVNYLGGNMRDLTLNFSRPGGQVVCQYYNFLRLGREGYRKVHAACYATAQYLAREIAKLGPFESSTTVMINPASPPCAGRSGREAT